jgi:hypothetical protein
MAQNVRNFRLFPGGDFFFILKADQNRREILSADRVSSLRGSGRRRGDPKTMEKREREK